MCNVRPPWARMPGFSHWNRAARAALISPDRETGSAKRVRRGLRNHTITRLRIGIPWLVPGMTQ